MSKETKKLVKEVAEMTDMSELTVDKINETKVTEPEPQTQLTNRELADSMGCRYIEPKRKLSAFGKLLPGEEKDHKRDWEYVKGIYENIEFVGEHIEFWLCKYGGDPDCLWSIPANVPVFVPRMVAKHLEEVQKYHRFDYVDRNQPNLQHGDFDKTFKVLDTHYRGKFRPIEAFR